MLLDRPKTIRVLFAHYPPAVFDNCRRFPTYRPSIQCPFPGWCAEIIAHLADYLQMRVEPVELRHEAGQVNWGTYVNGTWDGVFGLIRNGTVDTACEFFQYTEQRGEHFAFSYPVTSVQLLYLVRARSTGFSSRMWNAFSPYGASAWAAMGVMLALQTAYCICLARLESKIMRRQRHYSSLELVWKLVRFQLYQPDRFDFLTMAGNFSLLLFTILQCRILMDMYQTLLLSSLLRPPEQNPFANGAEMIKMVAHREYQFVTNYKANWYFQTLLNAKTSYEMSLRAAIGDNIVETSSIWEAIRLVERGGYISPIQENSMTAVFVRNRCNLALISEGLPSMPSHLVFAKNYPHLAAINRAIIMQRDFIRRAYRKYMKYGYRFDYSKDQCHGQDQATRYYGQTLLPFDARSGIERLELKSLDLASMFGVFMLFSVGCLLSGGAFCIETSYHRKRLGLLHRQRLRHLLLGHVIGVPLAVGGLTEEVERWKRQEAERRAPAAGVRTNGLFNVGDIVV